MQFFRILREFGYNRHDRTTAIIGIAHAAHNVSKPVLEKA